MVKPRTQTQMMSSVKSMRKATNLMQVRLHKRYVCVIRHHMPKRLRFSISSKITYETCCHQTSGVKISRFKGYTGKDVLTPSPSPILTCQISNVWCMRILLRHLKHPYREVSYHLNNVILTGRETKLHDKIQSFRGQSLSFISSFKLITCTYLF